MTSLSHSYSSIKMYDNCPKRYHHQRILKDVIDPGSEASKNGDRVHSSFENRIKHNTPLTPDLQKHEAICRVLDGLRDAGAIVEAERELVIRRDLSTTHWKDPEAWLRSKLDVFAMRKNKAFIIDWKTGKRRPDFFQLEVSAVQTFLHYPDIDWVDVAFVWLKDNTQDNETYVREDLDRLLKKITDKTNRIEDSLEVGVWQAKPGPLCNYCPLLNRCEFAQQSKWR